MVTTNVGGLQKTTDYRVVVPFYTYAALSLLAGTILLMLHSDIPFSHHFNPPTLAITHVMALGWGSMMILGASYQLLPVLIEGELDSNRIAYLSFISMAVGIPVLAYAFFDFDLGKPAEIGAILINLGVVFYIANVFSSSFKSKKRNIHAWYIITASLWLFTTTFFGLLLVLNFNQFLLSQSSVNYLTLHAHIGLVGWFLLLVIGVGSRLIPMFLISKYSNEKLLWRIYALINLGLMSFILIFLFGMNEGYYYIPLFIILSGVGMFVFYCYKSYQVRIRKKVDNQVKTSFIAVVQMLLPILILLLILLFLPVNNYPKMGVLYGFTIFFGWITAIILGMTYKTLPFIVWNKAYKKKSQGGKTPAPRDLFNETIFKIMLIAYLTGYLVFILGILVSNSILLKTGTVALVLAAVLYVINTFKILYHQPEIS